MDLLKTGALASIALVCAGCQLGYYFHTAYHQAQLANRRKPIARELDSDRLNPTEKAKLRLVQDVKAFAESRLGLKKSGNYTGFVRLDEDYVTYIVQAAYAFELKPYLWHFPFVGDVPYKGYFRRALAEEEARRFDPKKYDTYVRGVSAYSTLGWFQDAVLSSMLRYSDADLVETIIHETVHTTLYVKDAVDFNERLATFLGHQGMILYFTEKAGVDSPNVRRALDDAADQSIFSRWLTTELNSLKRWYEDNQGRVDAAAKAARLAEIRRRFLTEVKPRLKVRTYSEFEKGEINNAMLLAYRTYEHGLEDFERLFARFGGDFGRTLGWLKGLARDPHPEKTLKDFVSSPP